MRIQLLCRDESGQIAFPKALIEGHHAPERRYEVVDHIVTLTGYPDPVLHHDADYLLSIPGNVYRMPTTTEQNALADKQRAAATVEEDAPSVKPKRSANGG